jgi:ABC-2 type transport system permease protein
MRMMEYRGDFYFWSTVSTMWTGFNFFFFTLLFTVTDSIAGWSQMELYAFLSIYMVIDALTWSFFAQNMWDYKSSIYSGSLSTLMLKPIHPIFMLLTQRNSYDNLPRLIIGAVVLFWSLNSLQVFPSILQILLFLFTMGLTITFLYTGWFFFTTWAFWVERLDNATEIMPAFRTLYEYPRQIYSGLLAIFVSGIFPIAFVVTLPAEVLLGRFSWGNIFYYALFTFGFALLANRFFYYSVKKYTSVGN